MILVLLRMVQVLLVVRVVEHAATLERGGLALRSLLALVFREFQIRLVLRRGTVVTRQPSSPLLRNQLFWVESRRCSGVEGKAEG